jgi:RND family efflux transporter MFP subunit
MADDEAEESPEPIAAEQIAAAAEELAACEGLAPAADAVARWSAGLTGSAGALVWTPDPAQPLFHCAAARGNGLQAFRRRTAPRDQGLAWELVRDRQPLALDRGALAEAADPLAAGLPGAAALALPIEAGGEVAGLLVLVFADDADPDAAVAAVSPLLDAAGPALARTGRAEKKTAGMLRAIERLTNLYDLSKAFGSTLEWAEITRLAVRKAADFAAAEAASVWLLDGEEAALAATEINANYEVESPPAAVGSAVVGDVLASLAPLRRNGIPENEPAAREEPAYAVRSLLAVPLEEDGTPVGALVLANKRGRHPEFTAEDEELLQDVARQVVRALRIARQHEAEKKVEELDALLAVSREITATLDLDKVMQAVVNATAALITYDRCAIGILEKGRLRLGAVSGSAEVDRGKPEVKRLEGLLQWVFFSGHDVSVTRKADGAVAADRAETEEKFRAVFAETGLASFHAALLSDEEGKLGVLAFESKEPLEFDAETRDLLQILVNQATVAVRNAQLYRQVPLAGFWKPLVEKRRKLGELPRTRRRAWLVGVALAALLLVLVPWRLRIAGPARVLPGSRAAVTSGVDGVVAAVAKREGDRVAKGEVIARLKDESYAAGLAQARAELSIAESEVARLREAADAGGVFDAESRRQELAARIALAQEQLGRTRLVAPIAGVIVTPRIDERVGQVLRRGSELCVVADLGSVTVEVAVPEEDAALVEAGQPVALKVNTYPTRTFAGTVARMGVRVREEGDSRFVIAEVRAANPEGVLKTGMAGTAKIRAGSRSVATLLLRKPARWTWRKLWPLLP